MRIMNMRTMAIILLFMTLSVSSAQAAPNITGINGINSHGNNIVISGSDFGTKQNGAPVVWDDCSGDEPLDLWDGKGPTLCLNSTYNIAYRTPIRGIALPHGNITKYLAGAHGETDGRARNVYVWKNRTVSSFPAYTYASWYQRSDNNWTFGGDNNYKCYDWSGGTFPYNPAGSWYTEYNPRPTSSSSSCSWHLNDNSMGLGTSDSWWGASATNPMSGQWAKIEIEIRISQSTDGYVRIWDNGRLVMDFSGRTDNIAPGSRLDCIGGYASQTGQSNNWRYFADLYLDYTIARVIIGNASTLSASTVREVQIPSIWTGNSINIRINQGVFLNGQQAYLYVQNSNGEVNVNGYPLTISQSQVTPPSDTTPPAIPTGVSITTLN